MARKIPNHITDNSTRLKLAEIAESLKILKQEHARIMRKVKNKTATEDELKLLKKIIKAINDLDKLWRNLTPSILDLILNKKKNNS